MAAKTTLTGNLGRDPEIRFTPTGKAVTSLNVACTPSRKNRDTGQWEDTGSPLWIEVSFWGEENTWMGDALRKGDKVAVEGTLMKEEWAQADGGKGSRLRLAYPHLLGYVRKRDRAPQEAAGRPGGDAWPGGFSDQAPF